MGMPSPHQVHEAKAEGAKLSLSDFHPQWHMKAIVEVRFLVLIILSFPFYQLLHISHSQSPHFPSQIEFNAEPEPSQDSIIPSKEKNSETFMGRLYNQFDRFEAGEQQFYISKIEKILSGVYSTAAVEEPLLVKDHQTQGRTKNPKRKHISTF